MTIEVLLVIGASVGGIEALDTRARLMALLAC